MGGGVYMCVGRNGKGECVWGEKFEEGVCVGGERWEGGGVYVCGGGEKGGVCVWGREKWKRGVCGEG